MGGGGGGTSTSTNTDQRTSTFDPWVQELARNFGGAAGGYFPQGFQNGQNTANLGAQQSQDANNMLGGAYNQAQNASQYNYDTFQNDFMNPYTENLANQTADMMQRNFNQQTAPSLMAQFGNTGQFNSGRANNAMAFAQTQNQQNINQNVAGLMNQGYQQAQDNYLRSMGIGVQGAGVMGQQGMGQGQLGLQNQQLPGNIFGQYSQGLSGLPLNRQENGQQNSTMPVGGSNTLF